MKPAIMNHMTKKHFQLLLALFFVLGFGCTAKKNTPLNSDITKAEIRLTQEGYRIFLDGEPFYVKGAGVGTGTSAKDLAGHGANAARTWSTQNGQMILDQAHEQGLKVMMGIWVGLERHGFDYDDEAAVKKQREDIQKKVEKLKDHPALLCWGIGNELNHEATNLKVWNAVNDISKMIHKIDPYHLTSTTLAGMSKELADEIGERASDLDFLSIQLYATIDGLGDIIRSSGYTGPLLVTEWGATGYWEVPETAWGAPIENHSSKKADLYLNRYQNAITAQAQQVMGSFVFLWGHKQERTPTWFGMHLPDSTETESVDMMHYAWMGKWPANRTPRLIGFTLEDKVATDNIKLRVGDTYSAQVDCTDPDDDALTYRWEIMIESTSNKTGGDAEYIPPVVKGLFPENAGSKTSFTAPSQIGAYRLFVYVYDGNNHAAHANIPFWVE